MRHKSLYTTRLYIMIDEKDLSNIYMEDPTNFDSSGDEGNSSDCYYLNKKHLSLSTKSIRQRNKRENDLWYKLDRAKSQIKALK